MQYKIYSKKLKRNNIFSLIHEWNTKHIPLKFVLKNNNSICKTLINKMMKQLFV